MYWNPFAARRQTLRTFRMRPPVCRSYRPEFDWLEQRLLLAVDIWTGAASGSWMTAGNWSNGIPNPGDDLVFSGGSNLSSTNDLASGTLFHSITFNTGGFTLGGNGVTLSNGIIDNSLLGSSNNVNFTVLAFGGQTFQVTNSSRTLNFGGLVDLGAPALTVAGNGNFNFTNTLTGPGGFTENGPGTVTLAGAGSNTFTGTTTVNAGTLLLNKAGNAVSQTVVVGDNGTGAALVKLFHNFDINSGSDVTVNSNGTLDLNGFNDYFSGLTLVTGSLSGAVVTTGSGTLTLGSDVSVLVNGSGLFGARITGNLDLGSATRTFTVAHGLSSGDLTLNASISADAAGVGLTKAGIGSLVLNGSAANTFTGTTTVDGGILVLAKSLGADALAGNLVIGDGSGSSTDDTVILGASNQINDHADVTVNSDGQLNFNGHTDVFHSFNLLVTNTDDSAVGSLRQALTYANTYVLGTSNVIFAIPGSGTDNIGLLAPLPDSLTPVIIDGTTEPGFTGTPLIQLDGSAAGPNAAGLVLQGGSSTVRALSIINFGGDGIDLPSGGNLLQDDFIGLNASGTAVDANQGNGVVITDTGNTIGGTAPGTGNRISGNALNGILVTGVQAANNTIEGNQIGGDSSLLALGNGLDGVRIVDGSGNQIGGLANGAGNVIAGNGHNGVAIIDQQSVSQGNAILSNAIFGNAGLGIDLGNDGPTTNHNGPATGPNLFQNYPVLGAVVAGDTQISGSLNAAANRTYTVQFFANTGTGGSVQGQQFLGSMAVTTDATGNASFTASLSMTVAAGQLITATATDANHNTSEFSSAVRVAALPAPAAADPPPKAVAVPLHAAPPPETVVELPLQAVSSLPAMVVALPGPPAVTSVEISVFNELLAHTVADTATEDSAHAEGHPFLLGRELVLEAPTGDSQSDAVHLKALPAPSGGSESTVVLKAKDEKDTAGQIHGFAFEDYNGDGKHDRGEPLRAGEQVFLDMDGDGYYTPGEPIATTDTQGQYHFLGLPAGTYRVRRVPREQEPLRLTTPTEGAYIIVISPLSPVATDVNFGLVEVLRRRRVPAPAVSSTPTSRLPVPNTPSASAPLPVKEPDRAVGTEETPASAAPGWAGWFLASASVLLGLCVRRTQSSERRSGLAAKAN